MSETVKERKLFETTQYLITIAKRLTYNSPLDREQELKFVLEDIKSALKNIGTKQARLIIKGFKWTLAPNPAIKTIVAVKDIRKIVHGKGDSVAKLLKIKDILSRLEQ